ncbi:MAG: hypothetical protein ACYDCQ_16750 [Dehalococcoidia bacterium]
MACLHPSGTITDHTVLGEDIAGIRYVWRGACSNCRQGIVGSSTLPAGLPQERLSALLDNELMSYLTYVGGTAARA